MDYIKGETLLIDKPLGWSSFDVVKKIRYHLCRALEIKKLKVGHAGTLDPLATGLLILCTGKSTKSIERIQGQIKEYEATIKFGATTASYDAETPEENITDISQLTEATILEAITHFTGRVVQYPPVFSAVKVDGKRAFKSARKGQKVDIPSREIWVEKFEILDFSSPEAKVRITCGKGTYIRSLAHDLGQHLGTGAYLTQLRRSAIGDYRADDAWQIEDFIRHIRGEDVEV
ncbi:MAG: tRNA pseudouridine(55) synthase TruB [Bacteroidia bacterium]